MIHNLPFNINPFPVPSSVVAIPVRRTPVKRGEPGAGEKLTMQLSELDYVTLDAMCNEFRESVFAQAGIQDKPPLKPLTRDEVSRAISRDVGLVKDTYRSEGLGNLDRLVVPIKSDPQSIDL